VIKYEKKEIKMEVNLRKKIEFVCDFLKTKPIFLKRKIRNQRLEEFLRNFNH